MIKDVRVFILERDPFARNWMAQLMARDWRTHFVGDSGSIFDFSKQIASEKPRMDVLLLEADLINDEKSLNEIKTALSNLPHFPMVLLTGLEVDHRMIKALTSPSIHGYVLREEIGYALSWAAAMVGVGDWVVTPSIHSALCQAGIKLPGKGVVLDGRKPIASLTGREIEAARLAFLFSLERHDLADELNISKDWSYGLVSTIYKKLGLDEILEGEVDPSIYLGGNALVLAHLEDIVSQLHGSPKARDIETLAFHIFTMPEIENY
jgi:hypothetical protein